MIDRPKCPVIYEDREYYGIVEFDCHNIYLYTEKTLSGTFSTTIPISSKEYRIHYKTKAKVKIIFLKDWTEFIIYDDRGIPVIMNIHNSLEDKINFAISSAVKNNLIKKNDIRKLKLKNIV